MSEPEVPQTKLAMLAATLIRVQASTVATVLEATDGYRAECLRRGYSESAAERMAVDYHREVMAAAFVSLHRKV